MEALFDQVSSDLLRRLFYHIGSREVTNELEAFIEDNCDGFSGELDDVFGEQDLDRFELYKEYCGLLDSQMKDFCEREGVSTKEVYTECQKACKTKGDFEMASLLLDMLVAATDYQSFCASFSGFKRFKEARLELEESKFDDDRMQVEGKCGESKYEEPRLRKK